MLKLVDIKKDYKVASGAVHALKGVSLNFRPNEFVCILGASGCGKTTLLNIIGGLDQYTSGDLIIQDKSTKHFKDRDWDVYRNHRIGFVFQSYNLIPHQTVLGNVELALTISGVSREERKKRAAEALKRVGLGEELDKKPNQLSGGQMQRVAIARALVNDPDILLADEPTGALDSNTSVQIMDLIKEIAGERLVIMVTHNPELAESYASRIVRLKDGLVESDSDPYEGDEEQPPKTQGKARAKMSFFTSLALSFRNLLTKKGRTILTSVAGSIGIISVCLVLALSNGFNNYIRKTEEDMLSYYPVSVSESAFDLTSMMTSFTDIEDMPDLSQLGDKVYIDSFLTSLANGMATTNNITDTYVSYLEAMNSSWYSEIMYSHVTSLADNLFLRTKTFPDDSAETTELTTRSLNNLKDKYIEDLMTFADKYGSLVGFADYFTNVVSVMPGTSENANLGYGEYVRSQYDVIDGHFPENENEAVLVVGQNNQVTDLTLAQLGFLDESRFMELFNLGEEDAEDDTEGEPDPDADKISYDDILGKEYTLFYNDEVYTKNEDWTQLSYMNGKYPFTYSGKRDNGDFKAQDGEGINIKISGILRLKDGLSYGCLSSGLCLTEKTIEAYIDGNADSEIVRWTKNESLVTMPTKDGVKSFCLAPVNTDNVLSNFIRTEYEGYSFYVGQSPDVAIKALGGSDAVSRISIYANDFDNKEQLLSYLDEWNTWCEEGGSYNGVTLTKGDKITYTDTVGMLMGIMQTMIDIITYVLVAFTAISACCAPSAQESRT